MEILISFCRVGVLGRPLLGLLHANTREFRVVKVGPELAGCTGIMGLAASDWYIFVIPQMPTVPAVLMIFDRLDLSLLNRYTFRRASDIHSIWVEGSSLYAVSSGTDEVLKLELDGAEVMSERGFWRPLHQAPRKDLHHLNAVHAHCNEMLVSGFGMKDGEAPNQERSGFIYNVDRRTMIAVGLAHPHSVFSAEGALICCESKKRTIRKVDERSSIPLPGYPRGICLIEKTLFVGLSRKRRISNSTGTVLDGENHVLPGLCGVGCLRFDDLEMEHIVNLDAYGTEIYDLLPVEGTSKWPIAEEDGFLSLDATWSKETDRFIEDVANLTLPGSSLILADEDKLGMGSVIAGRPCIPFLQRNGTYDGPPPDDETAIRQLESLRESGAHYMVCAWPAFWWLDHYAGFDAHLRSRYRCILGNERIFVFDLRA